MPLLFDKPGDCDRVHQVQVLDFGGSLLVFVNLLHEAGSRISMSVFTHTLPLLSCF